jgi:hypothetical protein
VSSDVVWPSSELSSSLPRPPAPSIVSELIASGLVVFSVAVFGAIVYRVVVVDLVVFWAVQLAISSASSVLFLRGVSLSISSSLAQLIPVRSSIVWLSLGWYCSGLSPPLPHLTAPSSPPLLLVPSLLSLERIVYSSFLRI